MQSIYIIQFSRRVNKKHKQVFLCRIACDMNEMIEAELLLRQCRSCGMVQLS